MSEITFKLRTPTAPNYILIERSDIGQRQDGFKENDKIALSELSPKQIDDLAEEFRLAMHERAKQQRRF